MKKTLAALVAVILLCSCAPTSEQIEKAIGETQRAFAESFTATPASTNTNTPEPTCFLIFKLGPL